MRLHVRETLAPTDDTPTAVYVHGLGGSSTNWTDLAGLLSGRLVGMAVDLPGFGRSEPPPGYDFAVASHVEVTIRLLESVGRGPVHLFGNSFGGTIALLVAARRPDLVRTLTVISPAMPDLRPSLRRASDPRLPLALLPVVGARVRRQLAAVTPRQRAEQMLRLCYANPQTVSEIRLSQAADEYAERGALPWSGPALGLTTMGLIRAWLAPRSRSLWRVLPDIQAPTLVVWGTEDRLVSVRKAPRTTEMIPRGRLLVLPRTGHVAQMERPISVARAVLGMLDALERGAW
jgi:pimeloyl-ACP methyl ester carboxylesterase